MSDAMERKTIKTIDDFGAQWTKYQENEGYYASLPLFQDILGNLLMTEDLKGKRVAEIGSGTGRIVNMICASGASEITALEPSDAFEVLKTNTEKDKGRITYLKCRGDEIPAESEFDYVLAIGVLHHIPDPRPVLDATLKSLRKGGRLLAWIYGKEGNELYLSLVLPLRKLSSKMPDGLLAAVSWILTIALSFYVYSCRIFPLPMKDYMLGHIGKLSWKVRQLTVFDQLNPAEARYYSKEEALRLLTDAGFKDVKIYHRHGYSWTLIGTKE